MGYVAALSALAVLLIPGGGGSTTQLSTPVRYHRVELASAEPVLLELALPAGECQVAPASLGYFTEDASGGVRRFVYSAEVPRGLIYMYQPPAAEHPDARGTVFVVEIAAPNSGEVYFSDQIGVIRQDVIELNRQRNLLLQARQEMSASRSPYAKSIDALWPSLYATPIGLRDGGWGSRVVQKFPNELPQLAEQLERDAKARGEQKKLYYTAQQARLKLLLSQYDLQRGLARLPRRRSDELLSMGNAALVQNTVLAEIDRLEQAWKERQADLSRTCDLVRGLQERQAGSLLAQVDPAVSLVAGLGTATGGLHTLDGPGAKQQIEAAELSALLVVQQQELDGLAAALPALGNARQHVNARSAPDWSSLPRLAVTDGDLAVPGLEGLRYYGALDRELSVRDSVELAAGLARQFETQTEPTDKRELPQVYGADNRLRQTLDGLGSGLIDASPDELAYGLLAVERCRMVLPTAVQPQAIGADSGTAPVPPLPDVDPLLASRAALAGQLDLILRNPDARGLAAYDLAYLRFLRWYCALGLPPEAVPAAADELQTKSYGFSVAAQSP
jgi:hypothetical protein